MTEANPISLRGLEMIVTYRGSGRERRDNLRGVLRHLVRTYSDFHIWLIEADAAPTFSWTEIGDSRIRHVFVHDTGPFPKARLVNLGALMTKSPIICMHDADMIANPRMMKSAVDALMDGDASDVLCPFSRVLNVSGDRRQTFIESGNFAEFAPFMEGDLPDDINVLYANTPGAINLFKRPEFIRIGGVDPQFTGWGGEDDDLFIRGARLGLRWHALAGPDSSLFHLIMTPRHAPRCARKNIARETGKWRAEPMKCRSRNWTRERSSLRSISADRRGFLSHARSGKPLDARLRGRFRHFGRGRAPNATYK